MSQLDPQLLGKGSTATYAMITDLERAAADLDSIAHKIGLTLSQMPAGLQKDGKRQHIITLRRQLFSFSEAMSLMVNMDIEQLEKSDVYDLNRINRAMTPDRMRTLHHFRQSLKDICVSEDVQAVTRDELIQFLVTDLSDVLADISLAIRQVRDSMSGTLGELATTDDLTGLPNRRSFSNLADNMARGTMADQPFAVMHIDIDRLKVINDTSGHLAGDAAIRHAGACIQAALGKGDVCARIGGDEFVIVTFGDHSRADLARRAEDLIREISVDFQFEGRALNVGASIGISTGQTRDDRPLDWVLKNSDLALYSSKSGGRGTYAFYEPTMRSSRDALDALATEMASGIGRHEFIPFFQPQVAGRTGKLVGLEALVRWQHPTRGLLSPYHFLDAAAEAGLLVRIDEYINGQVFEALRRWLDRGITVPQVSINLTAERLNTDRVVADLIAACRQAGVSPATIGIEILESAMIEAKSELMIKNVAELSAAGFNVELDDFGTGHASVSNLRFFKVDRIKIDKSFVQDIHLHNDLSMITASIIGLAHNLRIDALAEGVEKPEERLILNALGCDHIQGYGVAPPMTEEDTLAWISRTQSTRPRFSFSGK